MVTALAAARPNCILERTKVPYVSVEYLSSKACASTKPISDFKFSSLQQTQKGDDDDDDVDNVSSLQLMFYHIEFTALLSPFLFIVLHSSQCYSLHPFPHPQLN